MLCIVVFFLTLTVVNLVAADLNVTVYLDATYTIDSSRGSICIGDSAQPNGTACPLKGDVAIADCHSSLPTYTGSDCIAPVDAECRMITDMKWGCVFIDHDLRGDAGVEDLTSTLTIISDNESLQDSPWGDLPWRAPPPLDSIMFEKSSLLQTQ